MKSLNNNDTPFEIKVQKFTGDGFHLLSFLSFLLFLHRSFRTITEKLFTLKIGQLENTVERCYCTFRD